MPTHRPFGRRNPPPPAALPRQLNRRGAAAAADVPPVTSLDDNGIRLAGALAVYAAAGAVIVLGLASVAQSRTPEAPASLAAAEEMSAAEAEPCAATMAEFYRLRTGMSYVEARRVVGCEGEMVSQLELSGTNTAMVRWDAANTYFGSLTVTFQNNRLVSRSQFALR